MSEPQLIILVGFVGWAALMLNFVGAWEVKKALEPRVGERMAERIFVVLIAPSCLIVGLVLAAHGLVAAAATGVLFLLYVVVISIIEALYKLGSLASKIPPMAAA